MGDWIDEPDLFNSVIVRLAMGGDQREESVLADLMTRDAAGRNLHALLGILNRPSTSLQTAAEGIVLANVIRLVEGEPPLTQAWRKLIAEWCRWKLRPHAKGRRTSKIKKRAVCWLYVALTEKYPSRKRESIIEQVAKEFKLKRRRVFNIIGELPDSVHSALNSMN